MACEVSQKANFEQLENEETKPVRIRSRLDLRHLQGRWDLEKSLFAPLSGVGALLDVDEAGGEEGGTEGLSRRSVLVQEEQRLVEEPKELGKLR